MHSRRSESLIIAIIAVCLLAMVGCNRQNSNPVKDAEIEALRGKVYSLEQEIAQLKLTPRVMLDSVKSFVVKRDQQAASQAVVILVSKFPESAESAVAKSLLNKLSSDLANEAREAERIQRVGFKAFKENNQFISNNISIAINSINFTNMWTFDNTGNEYHYDKPMRDNTILVASLSATSRDKSSQLPFIAVYALRNGSLHRVSEMRYRFQRWRDYGSYLGNYDDMGNDFSYSKTIPMTVGAELNNTEAKEPLVILASRDCPVQRNYERFSRPPVHYSCDGRSIPYTLTLADVQSGKYHIVKRFNFN